MAAFELIERFRDGRCLVRIVGGPHNNTLLVVTQCANQAIPPLSCYLDGALSDLGFLDVRVATTTATSLLESLLSETQLTDWRKRGRFWVKTRRGSVELGQLYNLRFRSEGGEQLVLCVVPDGDSELPEADIWTNLLLILQANPDEFFRVANWRKPHCQRWLRGPVPIVTRIKQSRRLRSPSDPNQASLFDRYVGGPG